VGARQTHGGMEIAINIYHGRKILGKELANGMINFDKILNLRSILNEIMLITKDAQFKNADLPSVKICHLLDKLVHMQSLNLSIRAELIEKMFSTRQDLLPEIINRIKSGKDNIILFDRRRVNADRRKLYTYLADDRRIGIADRRKRIQNIKDEIRSNREQRQR
jgi:hypothetical protein